MKVDIKPQWKNLANWYWDCCEGKCDWNKGMSVWEMLVHEYGAFKGGTQRNGYWVDFPDEKTYLAFLLRWS